jgi:hypothetical protein
VFHKVCSRGYWEIRWFNLPEVDMPQNPGVNWIAVSRSIVHIG